MHITTTSAELDTAPEALSPAWSLNDLDELAIPFERFQLDNGLTVIVHEDRKTPVVAVNVTYLVGAKDEPPGKTGFAHLFEHLMFGGSQNFPGSYLVNLTAAGASNLNGTTSHDRTNYYETVPTSALDYALFAESDRMGHFAETITQETLDQQREVVMNEKLQREGAPYGGAVERLLTRMYPPQHPYAHTVLGAMEDLKQATLDDVRAWFHQYYGPNNAILCLAGDIDVTTAREKVARYFGHIAPGPVPSRRYPSAWVSRLDEPCHDTLYDRIPVPSLNLLWNVPPCGHPDTVYLEIAASLLAGTRSAPLDRVLVHGPARLASNVHAVVSEGQLASRFSIGVSGENLDIAACEAEIAKVLADFCAHGPDPQELERFKVLNRAGFLNATAGASAVAGLLSDHQRLMGRPDAYRQSMRQMQHATPQQIADAASRWLDRNALHLSMLPTPHLHAHPPAIDRSTLPALGPVPAPRLPAMQRTTLTNGLNVILAERHDRSLLRFNLILPVGIADDPRGGEGTSRLMTALMKSGAGDHAAAAFSERLRSLGATISVRGGADWTTVELSSLTGQLEPALALYADAVMRPHFAEKDFQHERQQLRQTIAHELASPAAAVARLLPGLLYGEGHRYARAPSGTGTHASLDGLSREDVARFHGAWMVPKGATLVVAGDATLEALVAKLERHFSGWNGEAPLRNEPMPVDRALRPGTICVLPRPEAAQSEVAAALLAPASDPSTQVAIELADRVLSGGFSSRINLNLREAKRWTYGVRSRLTDTRGERSYSIQAPVQADKTAETMLEILAELRQVIDSRPITASELAAVQQATAASLASMGETLGGLCGAIEHLVQHELPDDYWADHAERVLTLTPEQANAAIRRLVDPDRLSWVVVGDRDGVEAQLREAGFGQVKVLESVD